MPASGHFTRHEGEHGTVRLRFDSRSLRVLIHTRRDCDANRRSVPRFSDDVYASPCCTGPLFHADEAESIAGPTRVVEVESRAVVRDGEFYGTLRPNGTHPQPARLAVCGRVPHRFLRNSKQTKRRIITDVTEVTFGRERHLDVVPLLDFEAVSLEGTRDTDVPERAGMKVV